MFKTPYLIKLLIQKLAGGRPVCQTKGRICAHCEAEIADRTAFVIAKQLRKRATDLGDPKISKELQDQAKTIMSGSWYEEFDLISNT